MSACDTAPIHDHAVAVYDRDDELVTAIVAFVADAMRNDGTAIVVATPEHRAALDAAFTTMGIDTEASRATGRYRALDARELLAEFMVDGSPDRLRFAASVGALVAEAVAVGPLCVFGEMVALLWDDGLVAAAIELETLWNDLAERHTFALLCAYSSSSLAASRDLSAAKQMCDAHSSVVALTPADIVYPVLAQDACVAYERQFVATPPEMGSVRAFVRASLRAWGDEDAHSDAEVVASELATNALLHARSPFRVSLTRKETTVRVAVRDASLRPPEPRGADVGIVGGRGMRLVAALACTWGFDAESDGKTVWADVERSPAR